MTTEATEAEFLRIKDVQALFKVTYATVKSWIEAGQLPAFKMGGAYYVRRAALDEMIASREAAKARHPRSGE